MFLRKGSIGLKRALSNIVDLIMIAQLYIDTRTFAKSQTADRKGSPIQVRQLFGSFVNNDKIPDVKLTLQKTTMIDLVAKLDVVALYDEFDKFKHASDKGIAKLADGWIRTFLSNVTIDSTDIDIIRHTNFITGALGLKLSEYVESKSTIVEVGEKTERGQMEGLAIVDELAVEDDEEHINEPLPEQNDEESALEIDIQYSDVFTKRNEPAKVILDSTGRTINRFDFMTSNGVLVLSVIRPTFERIRNDKFHIAVTKAVVNYAVNTLNISIGDTLRCFNKGNSKKTLVIEKFNIAAHENVDPEFIISKGGVPVFVVRHDNAMTGKPFMISNAMKFLQCSDGMTFSYRFIV